MESLVPTLETCKKLKEAGFPQDTYGELSPKGHWWPRREFGKFHTSLAGQEFAAPTAQELTDQLPTISIQSSPGTHPGAQGWTVIYDDNLSARGNTMAEALASLWLKLREALPNKDGSKLAGGGDAKVDV